MIDIEGSLHPVQHRCGAGARSGRNLDDLRENLDRHVVHHDQVACVLCAREEDAAFDIGEVIGVGRRLLVELDRDGYRSRSLYRWIVWAQVVAIQGVITVRIRVGNSASATAGRRLGRVGRATIVAVGRPIGVGIDIGNAAAAISRLRLVGILGTGVGARGPAASPAVRAARSGASRAGTTGAETTGSSAPRRSATRAGAAASISSRASPARWSATRSSAARWRATRPSTPYAR